MENIYKPFSKLYQIISINILFLVIISACTGRVSNHGTLNIENYIDRVIENKMEKAEVEELLGPPSTISTFNTNKWYYVHNTIKKLGFLKPEMINHKVYEIVFNDENRAITLNEYDANQITELEYNKNITKTKGNDQSILRLLTRVKPSMSK